MEKLKIIQPDPVCDRGQPDGPKPCGTCDHETCSGTCEHDDPAEFPGEIPIDSDVPEPNSEEDKQNWGDSVIAFIPECSKVVDLWSGKMAEAAKRSYDLTYDLIDRELEKDFMLHKIRHPIYDNPEEDYKHLLRVVLNEGVVEMPSGRCYMVQRTVSDD